MPCKNKTILVQCLLVARVTVYTVYTVYIVYTVYAVYTVYTVYAVYTVDTMYTGGRPARLATAWRPPGLPGPVVFSLDRSASYSEKET